MYQNFTRPLFTATIPGLFRGIDLYDNKYVPLRYRPPSPDELFVRRIAKELKIPTKNAIEIAAPAMALLIDGPCWLVPVPSSNGSVAANISLAREIARMVPGSRVKCLVRRIRAVESSYRRRINGLPGLTIDEHGIVRIPSPITPLPIYFVDNVITTGRTIAACRRAVGWGVGLVYAEASRRNTKNPLRPKQWPVLQNTGHEFSKKEYSRFRVFK